MDMTFKLQVFEGPLDLLLYLIEKNKVNIYDIPIVEITAQYMEYVNQMKKDNLDTLSEFLVMAATLLDIKSKMLLPKKEEEEQEQEDPRAELVQQLLEYKMYKCMANELKDRQLDAGKVWYKKKDIPDEVLAYEEPVNLEELVGDIRLSDLNRIFQSIMKRQEEKIDKVRSKFGKIEKEEGLLRGKDGLSDRLCCLTQALQLQRDAYRIVKQSGSHSYISCHTGAYEDRQINYRSGAYF